MKGVFIRVEKEDLRGVVEELLESNASTVHLSSSAAQMKKLRNSRLKLQREFFKGITEMDLEVEKIKAMLPEVKVKHFVFKPDQPSLITKQERKRRSKYEKELEEIKARLDYLRRS
jgi:hypothetical protein